MPEIEQPRPPGSALPAPLAEWKRAALILGAGAVGGVAYWIIQFAAGAKPLGMPWYAGVPSSILLGAVASGVGVYLIANSDTNELRHTMAFAAACGIFWSPVISSARNFVQATATTRQASDVGQAADTLQQTARTQSRDEVVASVEKTTHMTSELLQKLPTLADDDAKRHAVTESKNAVEAIGNASEKAPEKSIEALQQLGAAAVRSGQDAVAGEALAKLQAIRLKNPDLTERARAASATIVKNAQSKLGPAAGVVTALDGNSSGYGGITLWAWGRLTSWEQRIGPGRRKSQQCSAPVGRTVTTPINQAAPPVGGKAAGGAAYGRRRSLDSAGRGAARRVVKRQ